MSERATALQDLRTRASDCKERGDTLILLRLLNNVPSRFNLTGKLVEKHVDSSAYLFDCDEVIAWCDGELGKEVAE